MSKLKYRLILASSSPYRCDLLKRLKLPFLTVFPEIDENFHINEHPKKLALRLSLDKAMNVLKKYPDSIVIGSDQVASIHNKPIGKPVDLLQAKSQLFMFSEQVIMFYSAVTVTNGNKIERNVTTTLCQFRKLNQSMIDSYLKSEIPYDTVGGIKIEGIGISLMKRIRNNDPTAIIGMPLIMLTDMLMRFDIFPLETINNNL